MKRIVILLSLVIFCTVAICYAVPYYRRAQESKMRQTAYAHRFGVNKPLVLDAATQAILAGADRVETFRLQGGGEHENASDMTTLSGLHPLFLEDHAVIRVGSAQGQVFASALRAALAQAGSEPDGAQCFEPGVGFRAWKGKAHTDICVCFTCMGIEIITKDAKHSVLHQSLTVLGTSRPALLALSQQAFPQDSELAALK
ncbi:MAG: hypothetical protein ACRYFS_18010 [Janthinobacterium lividum]